MHVTSWSGCSLLLWSGKPVISDVLCQSYYPSNSPVGMLQELMKLPAVSPEVLGSFEQAFSAKRSEKDQRNLIRKLLFSSGEGRVEGSSATAACQWQSRSGMALQCSPIFSYFYLLYELCTGVFAVCVCIVVTLHGISMVSCTCASFLEHCSWKVVCLLHR